MTNNIKVSEIMTKSVIVAGVSNTFEQVMSFFTEFNIQHLPVTDGGLLVGVISVKDMAAYVFKQAKAGGNVDLAALNENFKVRDVMTPNPVSVAPDDTAGKVVDILAQGKFQALPVAVNFEIQGIVTNKDLVRMLQWEYTHGYGSSFSGL
jgi:acetoin utilization protein AcuB